MGFTRFLTKWMIMVLALSSMSFLLYRIRMPVVFFSLAVSPSSYRTTATNLHHLLFSLVSSNSTLAYRAPYIRLWYSLNSTRAFTFVDTIPPQKDSQAFDDLPPMVVCHDTSMFPFHPKIGLRSAVRAARIVKEAVALNQTGVRWFIFGDDDTVFFVDNLVNTLAKYDHRKWYYIGSNSDNYDQNEKESFEMAFGGAGIAISYPLAKVLAEVLDSCLLRYGHMYGGDERIFSCLVELGVPLTHEPGFHQVDMRGNLFGLLSSHPLSPLVSLHHLDYADPIFPNHSKIGSMKHLFEAASADPARILQQTVCYNHAPSFTVSVSWGFSVQVFQGNKQLRDILRAQKSFQPWRRRAKFSRYMFDVREHAANSCDSSAFFLDCVYSDSYGIHSNYSRINAISCDKNEILRSLSRVSVVSEKTKHDAYETLRRQCCDIVSFDHQYLSVSIRKCGDHELITMP